MNGVDDVAGMRIGTTDRDRAVSALGRHFSEGRLDLTELEERSGRAATARTTAELARLFSDLPGGLPAAVAAPQVRTALVGRSHRPGRFPNISLGPRSRRRGGP